MSVVEDPQPTRRRLPLNVSDNDGLAPRQDEDGLNDTPAVNIEGELGAWICVLGAFIFVLPAFGFMQTIGTVQSYLQLNQLGGYSTGDVGWITGIHLFLSYCFTIQIGPICDHDGPMVVGPIGVAITIISFLLAAECKVYWQFMLCFGVLVALGGAITATSAMSAIAKLFVRRRGLAIGLTLTGSTTGSIIFPMMLRSTLPALGWQWSMRLLAFVIAGLTIPGLFCFLPYRRLVARLPDQQRLLKRSEAVLDFSAFRSPSFTFICAGSFLLEFAIYGIAGLLPSIAISSGLNSEDGYTLITVLSACSFFGRALPGLMADFFGPFNVLLAINAFTIVCMATLFIPFAGKSRALLYAFAGLWGFGSGCFFAMPLVCMGRTCTAKNYGRFYGENNEHSLGWTCTLPGTMSFFVSFAVLLTVPMGGILLDRMGAQALAGLMTASVVLGGICYGAARALMIGDWFSPSTVV